MRRACERSFHGNRVIQPVYDTQPAAVARVAEATELPVAVDVESGYGDTPRKVGETIALAIKAGAIGCNLEDSFPENGSLRETKHQVDRIRHARQKADETDVSFFINAGTDVFIQVSQDEHNASLVGQKRLSGPKPMQGRGRVRMACSSLGWPTWL